MKLIRPLLSVGLCALVLVGCVSAPPKPVSPAVGNWMIQPIDADDSPIPMCFKTDGTFTGGPEDQIITGIYMTNGNSISGRTIDGKYTFSGTVNGDTMELVDSDGNKAKLNRKR